MPLLGVVGKTIEWFLLFGRQLFPDNPSVPREVVLELVCLRRVVVSHVMGSEHEEAIGGTGNVSLLLVLLSRPTFDVVRCTGMGRRGSPGGRAPASSAGTWPRNGLVLGFLGVIIRVIVVRAENWEFRDCDRRRGGWGWGSGFGGHAFVGVDIVEDRPTVLIVKNCGLLAQASRLSANIAEDWHDIDDIEFLRILED